MATHVWHTLAVEAVLKALDADRSRGVTSSDAVRRLTAYGPNAIQRKDGVRWWRLLLEQFEDALVIILLIACVVSASLGHEVEAITIGIIVLFAVLLGFVQEYRAERAIESLRKMAAPTATVLRDGHEQGIPAADIVPGDILLLHTGDRVAADARVLESVSLHADEASLTGESLPVSKITDPVSGGDTALGDRRNMVYAGTSVTYGRGSAVVAATGMQTELGRIAGLLQTVETTETPLQENLDRLGKALAKAGFAIVAVIVAIGLLRDQPLLEMLIFGIALAVAVVPEALPAVVTISLAIGVQRMVKRHALVRRLPAVEALGSTTIICTDKTGTLTKDEMTVRRIACGDRVIDVTGVGYAPHGDFRIGDARIDVDEQLRDLLRAGTLASDARIVEGASGWDIQGDPTEGAIVTAAAKAGIQKEAIDRAMPRIGEIPFTSETKRMVTLHQTEEGTVACAKGAPEMLLPSCTREWSPSGLLPLTAERRDALLGIAKSMAADALRVLAIASRDNATLDNAGEELVFLGFVGMIDPPRSEVAPAVATCRSAGIRVMMITGDHPVTAQAIARELTILTSGKVVTGVELSAMSDEQLAQEVERIDVCARVSPEHKLRVVTALQARGHIAAMTGDGVNDAPALKKADIGIAMGITGTDVSKDAAAMVLTDDNFASIVAAIEEGRAIFSNIKKYLMYLLSSNIGEICIMTTASLLGLPMPLSAVQILYINLATDGLPALALAVDPPDGDLMRRPPRNPRHSIFTRPVLALLLTGGLWSTAANLGVFLWALRSGRGPSEAMTMVFVCLTLTEFFKAYALRSDRHSAFLRPLANRWLNLAILWELGLLFVMVYMPFFHEPLGTFSLTTNDWLIVLPVAASVIPVLEVAKWICRRTFPVHHS
ncbi:MAG: Ca2+-transporting ATPase [Candidatus Peregrinibacteria bacterium Gr01-1014_25]|nr:MAG: Ca2+-transporting ATPase [Candidatus Peregrinibacteria bacterium Gr01-1014_25]